MNEELYKKSLERQEEMAILIGYMYSSLVNPDHNNREASMQFIQSKINKLFYYKDAE